VTLEDEEGLSERKAHVQQNDNDVIVAETANGHIGIFDVLYQFEAILYHAPRSESCT